MQRESRVTLSLRGDRHIRGQRAAQGWFGSQMETLSLRRILVSADCLQVHRWRDAKRCHSQGESILNLTPDTAVLGGVKIYKWCSTRLPTVFCCRTRCCLPEHVVTPHFWPLAEG